MFFEAREIFAVSGGDVFDEAIDEATLRANLYTHTHGVIDGDERKTQSNGKNGSVCPLAVGNGKHERCDKGTVCAREVSRLKEVCPIETVFDGEAQKLDRLRDKNHNKRDDKGIVLREDRFHIRSVYQIFHFFKSHAIL